MWNQKRTDTYGISGIFDILPVGRFVSLCRILSKLICYSCRTSVFMVKLKKIARKTKLQFANASKEFYYSTDLNNERKCKLLTSTPRDFSSPPVQPPFWWPTAWLSPQAPRSSQSLHPLPCDVGKIKGALLRLTKVPLEGLWTDHRIRAVFGRFARFAAKK